MRASAHTAISGISAFAMVAFIKQQNPAARLPYPGFAALVAALASGLPDVLEPATSPHHRQFCHSAAFAALITAGMKKLYDWVPLKENGMEAQFWMNLQSHFDLEVAKVLARDEN